MKISMVSLPKFPWWDNGTPAYENNLAMRLGSIPVQKKVQTEHKEVLKILNKYAKVELFPFPQEMDSNGLNKHDFIFSRDSFISNQKGDVVISNFSERERQAEAEQMYSYLEVKGYRIHRLSSDSYAEGGEFYFVAKDDILFAGISRNNIHGISETARFLGIKNIVIVESDSFHLDTVFTILIQKDGHLAGIIVCKDLIRNSQSLESFAKKRGIELIDVDPIDTIAADGKGKITVNCLPLQGVLVGGDKFSTKGVEEKIKKLGIKHVVVGVSQFKLSGGGIHCLANELRF